MFLLPTVSAVTHSLSQAFIANVLSSEAPQARAVRPSKEVKPRGPALSIASWRCILFRLAMNVELYDVNSEASNELFCVHAWSWS